MAVIIVTYRSAELALLAIESVERERHQSDFALYAIVVDNASGDYEAIAPVIASRGWQGWVTALQAPRNGGFAYGNNLGMKQAFSAGPPPDYLYLLNPDAQVRPGAIATLVRFLEENPSIGIAGSSFENPDGSDWPIAFRFPTLLSEMIEGMSIGFVSALFRKWQVARKMPRIPQEIDWICGASMLIRSAVVSAIGGMDENYFLYFEETEFCLRAKRAGFPTWYVPASRVMHIAGQSTQITGEHTGLRRLPSYWFASRRRYFATTYGVGKGILIDIVALVAHAIGAAKRRVTFRKSALPPRFIGDLASHSLIWRRNRALPALRAYLPGDSGLPHHASSGLSAADG